MLNNKPIMCECCKKAKATIKDFRFIDEINLNGKVLVCRNCFNLDDVNFVAKYKK